MCRGSELKFTPQSITDVIPDKLKIIKDKLAKNLPTAPLYDTPLFTRHLESAYLTMYDRYQQGLDPDHIYVEH